MTDNCDLTIVEFMLNMEAELVAMRQLLIHLATERFSASDPHLAIEVASRAMTRAVDAQDDPHLAIEVASRAMTRAVDAQECSDDTVEATERIQTEMDRLLGDVRQLLPKLS